MLIWLCEDYSAVQDQRDGHDAARKCTTLATQGLTVFLRCIKHWISQSSLAAHRGGGFAV
jgi:hypothetical protein